jgi:putative ABC transport system permease protein
MSQTLSDLRYAVRTLMKSPGFAITAILALALGIGANTAIFSVVNGVLLHALPYRSDDRLVLLWEDASPRGGSNRVAAAPANFLDWRSADSPFAGLAAIRNESVRLTSLDEPVVPLTQFVTSNYFDLLGVEPYLGRTFRPEEDRKGNERVVVLSYGLWNRVLGGRDDVVGSSILLDDESYTVVGVLRPDFFSIHQFGVQPDLFVPLVLDGLSNDRADRRLVVYGRLKEGATYESAQASMTTLARRLAAEFPDSNDGWTVRIVPVREEAVGRFRTTLLLLLAAVGFVLLIACANVANLTLARASGRAREVALRRALGASQSRVGRQLLTESVLLAGAGGLCGLLLAASFSGPLLRLVPAGAGVPFLSEVHLDGRVLAFTFGLSLLTGALAGLAPIRQAGRTELSDALKEAGRGNSAAPAVRRYGSFLVVTEVALSLVLMAGAGLLIQSFRNLKGYAPGFDVERLLTVRNSLRGEGFTEPRDRVLYFEELVRRLQSLPGVDAVSGDSFPPPTTAFVTSTLHIAGRADEPGHEPAAAARVVLPDYFETLGIPLVEGRAFGSEDREETAPVAVINEALARAYFPDRDPVGETLQIDESASLAESGRVVRRIVGVVGNVRSAGTVPEPVPVIYVPHRQAPIPILSLIVRTSGDPEALLRSVESTAWSMGGDINVYGAETFSERMASSDWSAGVASRLLTAFALLALVLGVTGIYAVISYLVARRTHEIGLRMALGAGSSEVLRMVLVGGLDLTVRGIGVGLLLSLALGRFIASQLYGVSPRDLATFAAASALLLVAAAAASLVPAWRASRVHPLLAMRHQ